ncbi:MAG: ABC transporter substrate-binding protein [Sphingomicrobium sp.]
MTNSPARRALSLALVALAMLAPTACDNRDVGKTRVIAIGPDPVVRDPGLTATAGDELLAASIAQGLVSFDGAGNIVGGLAERWNVSDDGLSYIFRLAPVTWGDGRKLTAEQVARALRRSFSATGINPLRDTLGAVAEVVAMTDRVLEIRLAAPRPHLLALLAQPQFAVMRGGTGSGPFSLDAAKDKDGWLVLKRAIAVGEDAEPVKEEEVLLKGDAAERALAAFAAGKAELVIGGTFADVPLAQRTNAPAAALRFDPAAGLFGLVPMRSDGPAGDPDIRALLARAIDRDALIAALGVRGLVGRTTLLEPGLDGNIAPVIQPWARVPIVERRAGAAADARRMIGNGGERPRLRIYLPEGPGGDVLFHQLQIDWGGIGFAVERAERPRTADFALIDVVAPSLSPAWFVRHFRCTVVPVCDADVDALLDSARLALVPAERSALIAEAAALADSKTLFIALGAPIRWSMVGSSIDGFAVNRFARHSLAGLRQARAQRE